MCMQPRDSVCEAAADRHELRRPVSNERLPPSAFRALPWITSAKLALVSGSSLLKLSISPPTSRQGPHHSACYPGPAPPADRSTAAS
jgi:hypothetical protein